VAIAEEDHVYPESETYFEIVIGVSDQNRIFWCVPGVLKKFSAPF
jgi:hypothetical protein